MRVLALNPYHGGSHEQFLSQWVSRSRHSFHLLTLPPRHFKWRIRQAAVELASQANALSQKGQHFDVIWLSSIMNAAEFRGLLRPAMGNLPLVLQFHENQLVYPKQKTDARDTHFALTNWLSALAVHECWFNSAYNRDSFLLGLETLLKKMPDFRSLSTLESIKSKSHVLHLGIEPCERGHKEPGALHIIWVARWEHDKRPDLFFEALREFKAKGGSFRLTLAGQRFRNVPPEFQAALSEFRSEIEQDEYLESRANYEAALKRADVVVSTAEHEFFGLALLEAVAAGCMPVVPDRLVYPEIYPPDCLYPGDIESLAKKLQFLSQLKKEARLQSLYDELKLRELALSFSFEKRAPRFDERLDLVRAPLQETKRG